MSERSDGGPAFPNLPVFIGDAEQLPQVVPWGGMSLRDWFAGQALIGFAHGLVGQGYPRNQTIEGYPESELVASTAYTIADAMLTARDAKP